MTEKPLPCIVCGRQFTLSCPAVDPDTVPEPGQPHDAVTFYAYGQYGSTVFDPQDESQIRVNVCDPCLLERKDRVWHARYVRQRALRLFSRPWDPDQDPDD